MAYFKPYWDKLKKFEGIVFENNKLDTAGATKFGLVTDDVKEAKLDQNKDGTIDWKDVRDLDEPAAYKVAKQLYWDKLSGDAITNQSIAEFIIDASYNMGRGLIVKYVQEILGLNIDGQFGPKTLQAVNGASQKDLFDKLYAKRKDRYAGIIKANPSQKVFEKGWARRLDAIKFKA
jgi:lysozyme family protein